MKSRCLAFFNYQQSFLEIKKYIYLLTYLFLAVLGTSVAAQAFF